MSMISLDPVEPRTVFTAQNHHVGITFCRQGEALCFKGVREIANARSWKVFHNNLQLQHVFGSHRVRLENYLKPDNKSFL